ncbi:MAG: hypothetical protein WCO94_07750 [Verrucomicrobiota bacterium]
MAPNRSSHSIESLFHGVMGVLVGTKKAPGRLISFRNNADRIKDSEGSEMSKENTATMSQLLQATGLRFSRRSRPLGFGFHPRKKELPFCKIDTFFLWRIRFLQTFSGPPSQKWNHQIADLPCFPFFDGDAIIWLFLEDKHWFFSPPAFRMDSIRPSHGVAEQIAHANDFDFCCDPVGTTWESVSGPARS